MSSLAEHVEAEACPHLAVFLSGPEELPQVLVSFYALGVRRGGWLAHRALPGDSANERALLTKAGLGVAELEADDRMVIAEMDFSHPAEGSADPWREQLDAALARGLTGLWYARFPVDTATEDHDAMMGFEREWHRMSRDRPVVTICPFIVGDHASPALVEQVSRNHTGILAPANGGYERLR